MIVIGYSSLSTISSTSVVYLGLQIEIAVLTVNKGDYSIPIPVSSLPDLDTIIVD
jgi:hypothetical protein